MKMYRIRSERVRVFNELVIKLLATQRAVKATPQLRRVNLNSNVKGYIEIDGTLDIRIKI